MPVFAGAVVVASLDFAEVNAAFALLISIAASVAAAWVYKKWRIRAQSGLLPRKHAELMGVGDDPNQLRIVWDDIEDGYRALGLPPDLYSRIMSAWVLLEEERWSQARAVLESVDTIEIEDASDRIMYENNLAWAIAHDGEPDKAITMVTRALANNASSPTYTACLWGTLGAAQTLNREHTQAVKSLQRAIELDDTPTSQGIRHYYLGAALHELGETAEAIKAWRFASEVAPLAWQERAASKLRATATAYR